MLLKEVRPGSKPQSLRGKGEITINLSINWEGSALHQQSLNVLKLIKTINKSFILLGLVHTVSFSDNKSDTSIIRDEKHANQSCFDSACFAVLCETFNEQRPQSYTCGSRLNTDGLSRGPLYSFGS